MKAAADSNPQVLRSVLAHRLILESLEDNYGRHTCPCREAKDAFGPSSTAAMRAMRGQDSINTRLLQAIPSRLHQIFDLFLEVGANSNGIGMDSSERYQALLLRFWPSVPGYVNCGR